MENVSVKIDYGRVKKVLIKNNYVLGFSILAIIMVLVSLFVATGISFGLGDVKIVQFFFLFGTWIWVFLALMFVLSAVIAYYEKYNLIFLPVLIWLLFMTVNVRTQNIPNLKDVTTGNWTLGPDLDPFLFLRNAIEISNGDIFEVDKMRYAPLGTPNNYIHRNMLPWSIFYVYKIVGLFSSESITYSAIIAPVIFSFFATMFFFLFSSVLFSFKLDRAKSYIVALIATLFYVFSGPMLHRTTGGIPELESLGMVWFWLALLFYVLAWKQRSFKKVIIFAILSGVFTGAMNWTWGGYRYIYMTIALTTLVLFFFQSSRKKNYAIYFSWLVPSLLLSVMKSKSLLDLFVNYNDSGFAIGVAFLIIVSLIVSSKKFSEIGLLRKLNLPESVTSIILSLVLAIVILIFVKPSLIGGIFSEIISGLLYPFGTGRVGLTVAENKAPYFVQVFSSFGYIFWAFFFGLVMIFFSAVKHFDLKKRIYLNLFFIVFLSGLIFSRISSGSLLNGDNFLSSLFYLGGIALFGIFVAYDYIKSYRKKDKTLMDFKKIDFFDIFILSFSFFMIISMRGAIRLFFIIAPLLIIVTSYFVFRFLSYSFKIKDKVLRLIVCATFIIFLFLLLSTFSSQAIETTNSAKATVPTSYDQQWQYAMSWVRENTPVGSIFTHWWDYGYWVQSIGQRPTVSDGGHYIGYWDHLVGRYLLTTPFPETAYSLMKAHNVSYLLIDSTDLGKYSAYSSIGSDNSGNDRFSSIPIMVFDPKQTVEKEGSRISVYSGGMFVDEDINYEGKFIPGNSGQSFIAGLIWESSTQNGTEVNYAQPLAVYYNNGQRSDIPVRYAYVNGQLLDFGKGLDSTVMLIPSIDSGQINPSGAVIYLSPKVSSGLFAQIYLLGNIFGKYDGLELVHSEDDAAIKSLNSQGFEVGEFVYYQGFRGQIKIWKVNYPGDITFKEEFLRTSGEFAEFDNLEFRK